VLRWSGEQYGSGCQPEAGTGARRGGGDPGALDVDDSGLEPVYDSGDAGIDEIALTRGHGNYVAVISNRDAEGKPIHLSVLPNRLKATVKAFLESIPEPLKATIRSGLYRHVRRYVNAVYEALPGVTVVVDRFHWPRAITTVLINSVSRN